ncbi:DNA/RNA nuclease SfsA [Geomobilimonas luticola]|uniref:Sugar fermentation stimulation protein homolog n=1 Tax=Geomobilimonas luticola TaxID=1114878 RepID=A0ABS5SGJ2_9BACT|nr:DNA/RNA nuclease SfsA [Geomobilimonas luticola]MBT0654483.1 DNA/RNA nuclease SfsA [Geomobilimonas luticola]
MRLPSPLFPGRIIKRYQRFLADIQLDCGTVVTAHCPNSGSMLGCMTPGSPVLLSQSHNPSRKLKYTWELVSVQGYWIGINTGLPNRLVHEAIEAGVIQELQGYTSIRPEVPYGTNSRIDLLLTGSPGCCYVEVKNVTLREGEMALFPDAVTTRGQKHLRELIEVVRNGARGVIFFVVQREDCHSVSPADAIDPEYGRLLRLAVKNGVEALAYQAFVTPEAIQIVRPLPVML